MRTKFFGSHVAIALKPSVSEKALANGAFTTGTRRCGEFREPGEMDRPRTRLR